MEEKSSSNIGKICEICNVASSKYCCPRCNSLYCSLDCYKSEKHLECSEDFYKECINQELASQNINENDKRNMYDILKNINDQEVEGEELDYTNTDSDDEAIITLETRLKDVNLDDANLVWCALTEDERNEFEALIQGGDVGSIVPNWEPWWMYRKDPPLVEEITKNNDEINKVLEKCPNLINVPKIDFTTGMKPSPMISFNILNVIASYGFVMRYFNGEIDPTEAAASLLDICCNLNKNTNFENVEIAIETVSQRCLLSDIIETDKASLEHIKNDAFYMLRGPDDENKLYYCKAALSHVIQILRDAKSQMKIKTKVELKGPFNKKFPDQGSDKFCIDKTKLTKSIKKLEFYLSFLNSCDLFYDQI